MDISKVLGVAVLGLLFQNSFSSPVQVRTDTSGATGSAVPTRAELRGLTDGTNLIGHRSVAASTLTLGATPITGIALSDEPCTWSIMHNPAAATKATISRAANASGRHVAKFYQVCFAAAATAGPASIWAIRDGLTGAGTVLWPGVMAAAVNSGGCVTGEVSLIGTTNTGMTIEFNAAGAATTIQSVALCGYDVN